MGGERVDQHTSKRLNKHVDAFVAILIATCREKVQSVVQVEIIVAVEMTADKVVDFLLILRVEILKFVRRAKANIIDTSRPTHLNFTMFKPLGRTPSGLRLIKCSASNAVTWLTVVKTSAL